MANENAEIDDNHNKSILADYLGDTKKLQADINGSLKATIVDSNGDVWNLENNGAMPVNIQDQVTNSLLFTVNNKISTTTLAINSTIGSDTITATTGHGILANNQIALQEGENVFQSNVKSVLGDVLTLDCPLDFPYTTAATLTREEIKANVDGSSTPVSFTINPLAGQVWDIYEIAFHIESTGDMKMSEFGDIATGLTNGILVRKRDTVYKNVLCAKTNGDLYFRCIDNEFLAKPLYSYKAVFSFPKQTGVALRLDGDLNEFFEVLVRDDLTSLLQFRIFLTGHVVGN